MRKKVLLIGGDDSHQEALESRGYEVVHISPEQIEEVVADCDCFHKPGTPDAWGTYLKQVALAKDVTQI